MPRVFISYRRTDSAAVSGRIYDRLVAKFRRKNVFKDVDNIPPGVNFGAYIQESLRQCAVMLVVIGHDWLDTRASDGSRRLDNPADWVRVEIERALALGLTIIPLLVEGATMPPAAQLAGPLRDVVQINALPVRNDPDFARDMERVIAAVEQAFAARGTPGIFRRGAPPQPTQPAPQHAQPSQRYPSPSAPSARYAVDPQPATAPRSYLAESAAMPYPAAAPGVATGARPYAPAGLPRPKAPASAAPVRRVMLAGLIALLVVVSLGVLLHARGFSLPGAKGTGAATQTPGVHPTATPKASFPLAVAAPGPACDHGWSKGYWADHFTRPGYIGPASSSDAVNVDCSSGKYSRVSDQQHCIGPSCGGIVFYLLQSGIPLRGSYTISIKVSNFSPESEIDFAVTGKVGVAPVFYDFQVGAGNVYTVDRSACNVACANPYHMSDGYFNTGATNQLAFHVNAANHHVTAELNGKTIGVAFPEVKNPNLDDVSIGIFSSGYGATTSVAQVDLSDFRVGP